MLVILTFINKRRRKKQSEKTLLFEPMLSWRSEAVEGQRFNLILDRACWITHTHAIFPMLKIYYLLPYRESYQRKPISIRAVNVKTSLHTFV